MRELENGLIKLSNEEKQVLRDYINKQTKTLSLPFPSGVVNGLVGQKIIFRATNISSIGSCGYTFDYNIQPWAWDYLNENRHILN